MAVPTEFLRGLLGFLGMSSAFMTGRSAVATVDFIVWGMAAVAFAGGMLSVLRLKPPEDLTRRIFPDEP